MLKTPKNRREAVRTMVERLGGKLHFYFMSFGEYDTLVLVEMPDNVSATALVAAAMAGGASKAAKTTPLLTLEDAVEAFMSLAGLDCAMRSRPMGATHSRPMGATHSRPMGATHSRPMGATHSRPMSAT